MAQVDFGGLYDRYARDVMHFALYLTGNRSDAEDIVAETFVRAWVSTGAIRMETVKAYLLAIARNLYIERTRQNARTGRLEDDVATSAHDPEQAAEGRAELRAVMKALQHMPEVDRSALLMRARDVSYSDIAGALGISEAAARVKVHRARVKLATLGLGRS